MIELIGWAGSVLLALCVVPQAWQSYREGHSRSLTSSFLWMWFTGLVFTATYVFKTHGIDWPLMFSYTLNLTFLSIIIKYKYFERS